MFSRWLPVDAANREPVRTAISGAVDGWARRWFADAEVAISGFRTVSGPAPDSDETGGWRVLPGPVAIRSYKRNALRVAGLALDANINQPLLTAVDRQLLDEFELRIVADLGSAVEQLFDAHAQHQRAYRADPFDGRGGLLVDLHEKRDGRLLSVAVPFKLLSSFCFSSMAAPKPRSAPLVPIARALGMAEIRLQATLGMVDLSLAELEGLACGDVLVLDATMQTGGRLQLSTAGPAIAQGKLVEVDGHMAIAL